MPENVGDSTHLGHRPASRVALAKPVQSRYDADMRRRAFIGFLGGTAMAAPLAAHAQQPSIPVIGFLHNQTPEVLTERLRGLRQGLKDAGYVEGENVAIDYRWA